MFGEPQLLKTPNIKRRNSNNAVDHGKVKK